MLANDDPLQPRFHRRAMPVRAAALAVAVPLPEAASAVTFEHLVDGSGAVTESMFEQYSWGLQRVPRHLNKGAGEGAFIHHVAGTLRPAYPAGHPQAGQPLNTQWLVFKFRSEGVFTSTGAHAAVVLRSQTSATWNRGRGFIFGHQILVPGDPNACQVGPEGSAHAQPEIWWTTTSGAVQSARAAVLGQSLCSLPVLLDNTDYQVQIHAANDGWVAYWINEIATGAQVVATGYQDTVSTESALIDGLTGYSLALVFGASNNSWRLRFFDIGAGWF